MAISKDPNQFKLFMTGTEWQSQITRSNDGPLDEMWAQKTEQAANPGTHHGAGLQASLATHGYQPDMREGQPPTIVIEESFNKKKTHMMQSEGHHTVAAAAAHERETGNPIFIPTNYVDTTSAGRRARNPRQS